MKTLKMFVWHPGSLSDYTDGTAVAMAYTKAEAIRMLAEAHDDWESYKYASEAGRETVAEGKARMKEARAHFSAELLAEKPTVLQGTKAVSITYGGG